MWLSGCATGLPAAIARLGAASGLPAFTVRLTRSQLLVPAMVNSKRMNKSTSWFAINGVVLRRGAGLLLGALLVTACRMLPAAGAYGVAGEQPAFETAVAAGVATALFETQQAPQAAGASGMSPSFVMEQVLRDARADIEQMVAVAVATAVAARIDLPAGEGPVGGATEIGRAHV